MTKFKALLKRLSIRQAFRYVKRAVLRPTAEEVFTGYFRSNTWRGAQSVSGKGSDLDQTATLIEVLPPFFTKHGIASVLDIPCGDFFWMKKVDLSGVNYIGADIVAELIEQNRQAYETDGIRFEHLNLITDQLPSSDAIFCRDCLVHLSYKDVISSLRNICESDSRYLLATTFTDRKKNTNIQTGHWRPLNLELPPFNFPKPIDLIVEGCTSGDNQFTDKAMGLWRIEDVRKCIVGMGD